MAQNLPSQLVSACRKLCLIFEDLKNIQTLQGILSMKSLKSCIWKLVLIGTLFIVPFSAGAAVITLDAVQRGWIDQNTNDNGSSANSNYITGNCGANDCETGEFRSWFQFNIPDLTGDILSARFLVNTASVKS